jgi:hypothetical protein
MEYLDQPELDNTPRAHPAFWRGKANGINSVLEIVSNIMMGYDDGSGTNNHPGVEAMRRGILAWKTEVDKFKPEEKKVEKTKA